MKEQKEKFEWTRRKIGLIVLVAFLIVFLLISAFPESHFVGAPPIQYFAVGTVEVNYHLSGYPSVHFDQDIIFSAIGSFSVNNPVHVKILISNVNVTDFLSYYDSVTFTNGYPNPIEWDSQYVTPFPMKIKLEKDTTNTAYFIGEGDLVWLTEGPTYCLLYPNTDQYFNIPYTNITESKSVITITGVSDTLSTHFSEATAKIAWQIGSFSIIILQPVFEAILLKEPKPPTKLQK
ncbi:hypothetical protein JXA31_06525 [Candidatus Bathyarchaeota archaeon]|nr:hypothetical protein [Candidatus Bathyarchaeota archaeon]